MHIGKIYYESAIGGLGADLISKTLTEEDRKLLHDALDEWLDNGHTNGGFWVGDPEYFYNWER